MNDDLYSMDILAWTGRLPADSRLDGPSLTLTQTSRLCGSRLVLDFALDSEGRVLELGHQVKACAIGQAATAFFLQHLPGRILTDMLPIAQQFHDFLSMSAPLELAAPWDALTVFEPVRPYRARHGAALLPAMILLSAGNRQQSAT